MLEPSGSDGANNARYLQTPPITKAGSFVPLRTHVFGVRTNGRNKIWSRTRHLDEPPQVSIMRLLVTTAVRRLPLGVTDGSKGHLKGLTGGRLVPYHGNKGAKCLAEAGVGADPGVRPGRANPRVRPDKRERVCGLIGPRGTLAERDIPKRELGNEGKTRVRSTGWKPVPPGRRMGGGRERRDARRFPALRAKGLAGKGVFRRVIGKEEEWIELD